MPPSHRRVVASRYLFVLSLRVVSSRSLFASSHRVGSSSVIPAAVVVLQSLRAYVVPSSRGLKASSFLLFRRRVVSLHCFFTSSRRVGSYSVMPPSLCHRRREVVQPLRQVVALFVLSSSCRRRFVASCRCVVPSSWCRHRIALNKSPSLSSSVRSTKRGREEGRSTQPGPSSPRADLIVAYFLKSPLICSFGADILPPRGRQTKTSEPDIYLGQLKGLDRSERAFPSQGHRCPEPI